MDSLAFSKWLDDFFTSYYKYRPVNATFIGVHSYNHYLPDFSEGKVIELRDEMENLLTRLENVTDTRLLSPAQRVDRLLAANFLEIQLAEMRSQHFHRGNPTVYTGEAIFGIISLFLRDFAPIPDRIESAIVRMKAIPLLLEQGITNVRLAPKEWTEKAIQECTGATNFLGNGINQLMQSQQITSPALRAAAQVALSAFQEYKEHLSNELLPHPKNGYACGKRFFDLLTQRGHCLELNCEQVSEYGMARLRELQEQLKHEATIFSKDGDIKKILVSLEEYHPTQGAYLQSFQELWQECVRVATESGFLNWPNYPVRFIFVPKHFREVAPFLYFLPYRSPPAFDPVSTHDYLVAPIETSMPANERERRLRSMNYSVIKLNHVVHHGSIGHHLQNYYAYRAKSLVGRIAAVDCASRIAMFCGGTMAEGWAVYSGDLMCETAFYTELEKFAQLHSQVRMAARAVVDSNLHMERFTLEDAVDFYRSEVMMPLDVARAEAVKNSMFPGTASMYLLGRDLVQQLRSAMAKEQAGIFNLQNFHDRFLGYGSVPVPLIARDMLGRGISLSDN